MFLLTIGLIFGIMILTGTLLFSYLEGWSLIDAGYFTVMTITTVGFGDLVPTHDLAKIVTAVYSLISIPLAFFMFSYIARQYFELRITALEDGLKKQLLQEEEEIEEIVTAKKQRH
jgi:hypothetical protein